MEYYIALRKKSAKPDASAESALMDLQPYAVIAAEQALTRQDFIEAERLRSLIAAADPQAPSLARIADAIAKGQSLAAQQQAAEATRTDEQAKAAEAARLKAAQDALTAQTAPVVPVEQTTATPAAPTPAGATAGAGPRRPPRLRSRPLRRTEADAGRSRPGPRRRRSGRGQHAAAGVSARGQARGDRGPGRGLVHRQCRRQRQRYRHRQRAPARRFRTQCAGGGAALEVRADQRAPDGHPHLRLRALIQALKPSAWRRAALRRKSPGARRDNDGPPATTAPRPRRSRPADRRPIRRR